MRACAEKKKKKKDPFSKQLEKGPSKIPKYKGYQKKFLPKYVNVNTNKRTNKT